MTDIIYSVSFKSLNFVIGSQLQKQNTDLRARLARIHADSLLTDGPAPPAVSPLPTIRIAQEKASIAQSMSLDNFSLSEYYDAEENFEAISDTSTEVSFCGFFWQGFSVLNHKSHLSVIE